jgi:hypothetical protein
MYFLPRANCDFGVGGFISGLDGEEDEEDDVEDEEFDEAEGVESNNGAVENE